MIGSTISVSGPSGVRFSSTCTQSSIDILQARTRGGFGSMVCPDRWPPISVSPSDLIELNVGFAQSIDGVLPEAQQLRDRLRLLEEAADRIGDAAQVG
jgi:hypothetical protein